MRSRSSTGFTLVELLIVAALGSLALATVTFVLVRSIRTSISIELNQQVLNELVRVATFIELEVGEAAADEDNNAAIQLGGSSAVSCDPPSGTPAAFTLTLPDPPNASRTIQYYATGSGGNTILWRCGPPVLNNGTLDYIADPTAFPLGFNLTISNVSLGAQGNSVTFTIASTEPGLQQERSLTSTVGIRSNRVE